MPEINHYRDMCLDEELVNDALNKSIDRIRRLNKIPIDDPLIWRDAEDRSYKAIHEFANYYGIDNDDAGLKKRQALAIYIDKSIRNDINPLDYHSAHELLHMAETDSEYIEDDGVISSEYKTRFNWLVSANLYTDRFSDNDVREQSRGSNLLQPNLQGEKVNQESVLKRFRFVEKLRGFLSKSEYVPTSSRGNKLKRNNLIVKGIASVALVGVAIFGVSKGLSGDGSGALKEESSGETTTIYHPAVTSQGSESILSTQNSKPLEHNTSTTQVYAENLQDTEQVNNLPQNNNLAENIQVFAVVEQEMSVQKGDNLWRLLQNNFAYLNLEKDELNRRISLIMPEIKEDNPEIKDLNVIYDGQKVIINQEAIDIMLNS